MTTAITVLCPVLDRPQNAAPLVNSLRTSTHRAELIFLCTRDDREQIDACLKALWDTGTDWGRVLTVGWEAGPADWSRKCQYGYDRAQTELVLLGADDLRFHVGWLEAIERTFAAHTDAGVIGTNDMANRAVIAGEHSTHPVVVRSYIDKTGGVVDEGPGRLMHLGYDHQWAETELVRTAMSRGRYVHCHEALVEHQHPIWRTAPMDATYTKALAKGSQDAGLFHARKHLWEAT